MILLTVGIFIIGYLMILNLLLNLFNPPSVNRNIDIEIINKVNYNENDSVFFVDDYPLVSFWITTSDGEVELFRVRYTDLWERVNYRKLGKYIYFWFNGIGNETAELNYDGKPNKELRGDTNALIYKYNIETSEYEKIETGNSEKTIIIDVVEYNEMGLIIKEIATGPKGKYKQWDKSKTVVGTSEYDFTTTNCHEQFKVQAIAFNEKIILPTFDSIAVLSDNGIINRIKYPIKYPQHVELYAYQDNLISVVNSKYITIYNSDFEIIKETSTINDFTNSKLIENKIILYDDLKVDKTIFIGNFNLDTYELEKTNEIKYNITLKGSYIGLKHNFYTKYIQFYDEGDLSNKTIIELKIG